MGSSVSVTVADLVMEDVEQRALSTFPNPPRFWKRYVDDTCVALQSDKVKAFHLHLNSIEPTIQFNLELETAVVFHSWILRLPYNFIHYLFISFIAVRID